MRASSLGLAAVASAALIACGGKVFVDQPGAAGGGGSSSGTGVDPALCTQLCDVLASNSCVDASCFDRCTAIEANAPGCHGAIADAASCIIAGLPSKGCIAPSCVNTSMRTYETCVTASACQAATIGDDGSEGCIGKGSCGDAELTVQCFMNGACTCFLGNDVAGTCQEKGPFMCDFLNGCCATFFAIQE